MHRLVSFRPSARTLQYVRNFKLTQKQYQSLTFQEPIEYCRVPTVPAWIVFIFHESSQSLCYNFFFIRLRVTSAKLVARTRYSILMLHMHRTHAEPVRKATEIFRPVEVEPFQSQQCGRRSRLHSKCRLRLVKPFLTHFSSLGSFLFLGEIPAWPFFGKPLSGKPFSGKPFFLLWHPTVL